MRVFIFFVFLTIYLFAFEVQKPKTYRDNYNINGWLMSEKLDGIRGYWDGKALYTRNGNKISTPKNFTKNFPPFELDGELWTKRDDFENIQSIVLDRVPSNNWSKISYNIFEVPNSDGNFLERLDIAKRWFANNKNSQVNIIEQIACNNKAHMNRYLDEVISKKGEGLILKDSTKEYKTGRSRFILKVKKSFDMEGKVIGFNFRKDSKIVKSLKVKLKSGVIFNLGMNNKNRNNLPKIGEIVTFKYYGFTKYKKPKFATFLRVRKDIF